MTTLVIPALQAAGQSLATTAVSTATSLAISTATSAISRAFDDRVFEGPRLDSFHLQTSRDGAPMSRIFGRVRLAGQVIWASRIRETSTEERVSSGKGGGPRQRNFNYTISFAIGLCEGEILGIDRVWANGNVLQTAGLTMRVHRGSETQNPDPIITATERADVSAFRGTAYIVFEDFPLDDFGARLPQINAEVIRVPQTQTGAPRLEHVIKSVCLLPGSGEFSYAPKIVEETPSPGLTRPVNMNNLSGLADIDLALDQLEAQLPNCKNVSIISAWFGSDLRCGACEIRPGIERRARVIRDIKWQVGRDDRGSAYLVSSDAEGRPNFGGSPSDESLIGAIRELKSRGFSVTLYPFILMDIPSGNTLPNLSGGIGQPAFPWRGRIAATQDKTAQTRQQIDSFFGRASRADFSNGPGDDHHRASDFKYRQFILHHANIARRAGGVSRFIIGSEMRALTRLRDQSDKFPAVEKFVQLARDVKTMLGPRTSLTYAADWSEYFGYQPQDGSGDVFYHLDDLWADESIAAIGIDAYFPLSDWRDQPSHIDAQHASTIYDTQYLASQVEGGEGYDYFYASQADRDAQNRSDITDGGAGKPWVFRYKDVRNWWLNPHFERRAGRELAVPTKWQAQSKPFWFTEIGCPAVHNGANQPNVFSDPKSTESRVPYFSNGSRDDLIQRNYLEALIGYWSAPQTNPVSSEYGAPMVDVDSMSVWAWDARPFPDFPARTSVWSDGDNWEVGHWITGRMGLMPISYLVEDLARQAGVQSVDVSGLGGVLQGYHIDRPMSARAALGPLMEALHLELSERGGHLVFRTLDTIPDFNFDAAFLEQSLTEPLSFSKEDPEQALRDIRVHFIDISNDYQLGSISARDRAAETVRIADIRLPLVMDENYARFLAEQQLESHSLAMQSLSISLSPLSVLGMHVGDKVTVDRYDGLWRLDSLDRADTAQLSLSRVALSRQTQVAGAVPAINSDPVFFGRPACFAFDIAGPYEGPLVGSIMTPFEPIDVSSVPSGIFEPLRLGSELRLGALLSGLARGELARWDRANVFTLYMPGGAFSSLEDMALFSGGNKFAVETALGWEVLQIRDMTLTGVDTYRCKMLLRGLDGSAADMTQTIAAGARVIWLGQGVSDAVLSAEFLNETLEFSPLVNGRTGSAAVLNYTGRHLRPLPPVHVKFRRQGATTLALSWIRQSRIDADMWAGEVPLGEISERYRVRFYGPEGSTNSVLEDVSDNLSFEAEVTTPFYEGADHGAHRIDISQFSSFYGWGSAASITL